MDDDAFASACATLGERLRGNQDFWADSAKRRDAAFAAFRDTFRRDNIPNLQQEDFERFLSPKGNRHWGNLARNGKRMCSDMPALREALQVLLDESRPLAERLDEVDGKVLGFGKATITAVLLFAHPDKYGVWNNATETTLAEMNLLPSLEGASFGERYVRVNEVLDRIATELQVDLWTLDELWMKQLKSS